MREEVTRMRLFYAVVLHVLAALPARRVDIQEVPHPPWQSPLAGRGTFDPLRGRFDLGFAGARRWMARKDAVLPT